MTTAETYALVAGELAVFTIKAAVIVATGLAIVKVWERWFE